MFAVSPGVTVREFDITNVVPAVDTSVAAYAGVFRWGPIGKPVLIDTEAALVARFGKPTNFNAEGWFCAANFLSYSRSLYVSRAANLSSGNGQISVLSAVANTGNVSNLQTQVVKNEDDYENKTFSAGVNYVAKYPGALGNSLRISVVDHPDQFFDSVDLAGIEDGAQLSINVGSNTATVTIMAASNTDAESAGTNLVNGIGLNDLLRVGSANVGYQFMKVKSVTLDDVTGNTTEGEATVLIGLEEELKLHGDVTMSVDVQKYWEFWELVDQAPGTSDWVALNGNTAAKDELHVVVVDEGGKFTGVPGTVLEVYQGLSRATDAKTADNQANYYKDAINQRSQFVWFAGDRANAPSADSENVADSSETSALNLRFQGGADGPDEDNVTMGDLAAAWDTMADKIKVDVSLLITGKPRGGTLGGGLANYVIDNVAERRKDCVAFVSPRRQAVVNNIGNEAQAVVDFRNTLRSTSYAFMDSGYKYMYDRYNDVYRFVPLNGDTAGLAAQTDHTNDAWWSPAGFNRGRIKNIVRLAWNPSKTERDLLYKNGVNPVVSFEGDGPVLFGDKTLLAKPSAFDRINVRRLFIILEKAIAKAAQYQLFEFNDEFTRAQFRNMVNPYLRDIKGRRGISDFLVVCDETNNTGQVLSRNEFVGDIYIKPARSINFITLNFIAVGPDVTFSEVVRPMP